MKRKLMSKWHRKGINIEAFGVQGVIYNKKKLNGFWQVFVFDGFSCWQKAAHQFPKSDFGQSEIEALGSKEEKRGNLGECYNPGWVTNLGFWLFKLTLSGLPAPPPHIATQVCQYN